MIISVFQLKSPSMFGNWPLWSLLRCWIVLQIENHVRSFFSKFPFLVRKSTKYWKSGLNKFILIEKKLYLLYLFSFIDIILSIFISFRTYFRYNNRKIIKHYLFRLFLFRYTYLSAKNSWNRYLKNWENSRFLLSCFAFKPGKNDINENSFLMGIFNGDL